ncbi:MAG: Lrp/AsnC family transcriptional regulator [Pseudomonadota bacterium]|nr:Lrp/AsnC family transcriptional regulator [Pseudomonadota bacterium]
MDEKTFHIVKLLVSNARLSFNALAKRVDLSPPAVAERVRRLEHTGVLLGYHAKLERNAVGLPITAFVRLSCKSAKFQAVTRLALELPQVLECHHITGEACFLIKLAAPSIAELKSLIERFREYGQADSSVVLSSVVEQKPVFGVQEGEWE